MRIVIFDDETLEPITAITLPAWMLPRLKSGEKLNLPIWPALTFANFEGEISQTSIISSVQIWFECRQRPSGPHWVCYTRDGENSLRLRSTFLAGQLGALRSREDHAFTRGVVEALTKILR